MANTIILWRHGQTDWNVQNKFQGHTDIPLNSVGEFQVKHAAALVVDMKPTAIIFIKSLRIKPITPFERHCQYQRLKTIQTGTM